MKIDDEMLDEFKTLIRKEDYNALKYWSKKINPKVVDMGDVKKAILMCISSHSDRFGDRGRVHVLLEGEPGTAKSKLMMWLSHKVDAEFVSHRTTEVGLTGDMRGDEITPGALPRADGHIICIDELDKFSPKDRAGLLESMADGVVKLEGGGMTSEFEARTRVIAGCNSTDSFSDELLDRFDFHFKLEVPDKDESKEIMDDRIDSFFKQKEGYKGLELKKYVEWCRKFTPDIPKYVRGNMKKLIKMYIDFEENGSGIRGKEAVIRLAYTIAKLYRRDMITKDVIRAVIQIDESAKKNYKSMSENDYVNGDLKEPIDSVLKEED